METVFLANGVVLMAGMVAVWALSVRLRDASIVDLFWGLGFAVVALVTWVLTPVFSARGMLLCGMATIWGLRLAIYLSLRRRGKGEDRRYAAMREPHGERFALRSLATIFLFQGLLIWIVSLPLQAGVRLGAERPLGLLDGLGIVLFATGLCFEAIGDAQLARFLADPQNRGRVMQTGLWRYTRHPNYFGDSMIWWGIGACGLAAGAFWSLVGPAIMTVLLLRVSGVTMLEKTIGSRRPEYAAYAARTSPFFPWPPKASEMEDGQDRQAGRTGP